MPFARKGKNLPEFWRSPANRQTGPHLAGEILIKRSVEREMRRIKQKDSRREASS